jgi:Ice-binding-like
MKYQNKYVFVCLLAIATFLSVASFQPALAQSAPSLGAASGFSVLGGQAVTCTNSVITGDVGVSPTPAFTNAGCTIAGNTPPATDVAAALARTAFLSTYNALGLMPCGQTFSTAAFTGNVPALGPLAPGVYCFPAAVTFTDTTLTLDGSTNPNGIWIFKVGAALTGSGFHVVMANGAQACNVFWSVGAAVTLSTSTLPPLFQGNILAGNAAGGSVTITGGSLIGRVLANVAVTMTGTNTHGSCALLAQGTASCTADNDVDHHDKDKDQDHDKDRDKDKDKDHEKEQDRDR